MQTLSSSSCPYEVESPQLCEETSMLHTAGECFSGSYKFPGRTLKLMEIVGNQSLLHLEERLC